MLDEASIIFQKLLSFDKSDIKKIAVFCNVSEKSVIQATDVKTIYEIPKIYSQNGFDTEVLASMNIKKPKKIKIMIISWMLFKMILKG